MYRCLEIRESAFHSLLLVDNKFKETDQLYYKKRGRMSIDPSKLSLAFTKLTFPYSKIDFFIIITIISQSHEKYRYVSLFVFWGIVKTQFF